MDMNSFFFSREKIEPVVSYTKDSRAHIDKYKKTGKSCQPKRLPRQGTKQKEAKAAPFSKVGLYKSWRYVLSPRGTTIGWAGLASVVGVDLGVFPGVLLA